MPLPLSPQFRCAGVGVGATFSHARPQWRIRDSTIVKNEYSAAKRWLLVAIDSRILNWLPRGTKPRWCWSEIRWNHANLMQQFPSLIMALYGSFWPFSGNGDNREVTSSSWGSGGCLPLLVRWLESWTVARLKFGLTRPISFSFPHLNPWVASSLLLICF